MSRGIDTVEKEKALLIAALSQRMDESELNDHLDELALLADTAGAEVVGRVTQKISKINPAFYIGKGKAEMLLSQAEELDVSLLIFDDELSPAQIKNYHKLAKDIKVIDRSALILDIFQKHAQSKEAKTQVDLAYFEYLLPRLTRQWTHLERQMGGIGARAGMGETQIEIDRRLIREQISRLKKDLKKIEKERQTQGKKRADEFRCALVGYTNAGKSTLFNALTGAKVYVQNELFATLDTTIRHLDINASHQLLLSDTVGFIRKLPHHLVASFRSTLKEVIEANLLLIVLDMSSPQIIEHSKTIESVLKDLHADEIKTLIVLNKVDAIQDENLIFKLQRRFPDSVMISAKNHLRLSELQKRIVSIMETEYQTIDLSFSFEEGKKMAMAQEGVEVLEREWTETGVNLRIRGHQNRIEQLLKKN
ncbi:MAG: GTPase HflX [Candidatus Marinimicrobia bacterium]|jgi:GTP-binding protein HflX|nr:GTPase HflX [Candidatus Neomarinimicrobiota bacterium]MBT3495928.1 GTPase HflX [Candidatus Neomarinimicrobiota bacterium]MBT3692283.1 GTPase HflX [Candidatus Neomarinimicrobiota bacterium]MBT3731801.1 GTPase HflX [Candidatus Neomarinimicrobiota bacterium]MBT4143836.1 GTPase HflX [Candidatus Neomarinimicrobiota bacterium]